MQQRALITGGTGFIGSALVPALKARGFEVTLITRGSKPYLDGNRTITLESLAGETDYQVVINLAGENILGLWTPGKKDAIYKSRVDTTNTLVGWINSLAVKPEVFLSGSAVGIYGDQGDKPITEEFQTEGIEGFLPDVVRDWEAEAKKAETRTVLMRTSNVLDPSGGYLQTLHMAMRALPPVILGKPDDYVPWITREDWVELALFCLDRTDVSGPVNFATVEPSTQKRMTDTIAGALGKKVLLDVPKGLITTLLGSFGESILASERVYGSRAESLGFKFSHPNLETYIRSLNLRS